MFFESPHVAQVVTWSVPHRPVIMPTANRIGCRLSLGVTLDADVGRQEGVERGGVDDIPVDGFGDVGTTGAVTGLTADVPLGRGVCVEVVVDGVTTVAQGPCRPLHRIQRVEVGPPVASRLWVIPAPILVADIPLSGKHKQVVTASGKEPLFPLASVGECDVLRTEGDQRVVCVEIGQDRRGLFTRVLQHLCHQGVLPPNIDRGMAVLAGGRADEIGCLPELRGWGGRWCAADDHKQNKKQRCREPPTMRGHVMYRIGQSQ